MTRKIQSFALGALCLVYAVKGAMLNGPVIVEAVARLLSPLITRAM